jgi:hypothetical protein
MVRKLSDSRACWLLLGAIAIWAVEAASYFWPNFPPIWIQWTLFVAAFWLARDVVRKGIHALLKANFSCISLRITVVVTKLCPVCLVWNVQGV